VTNIRLFFEAKTLLLVQSCWSCLKMHQMSITLIQYIMYSFLSCCICSQTDILWISWCYMV